MRVRLLISVALIQIAGAIVATRWVIENERRQSYRVLDASLGEHAAMIQTLVQAPEEDSNNLTLRSELLVLPPEARYRVIDSAGQVVAGSMHWAGPQQLPSKPRSLLDFSSHDQRYRALMLRDLDVSDPEIDEHTKAQKFSLIYAVPTAETEAHIHSVALRASLAAASLLFLSMIAGAWAVTSGLRPLNQLAGRAAEIDSGHWTFHGLEESRNVYELLPLSAALANLLERLHAAFLRERSFFADAAHEMKTSVTIVKSTLQLALEADRTAEQYREELKSALTDTNRLQTLVGSMLDLVRIEGTSTVLSHGEGSICEVHAKVQEVLRRLSPIAEQAGIEVALNMVTAAQWVTLAGDNLQLVLSNLLDNAIKYSNAGQRITISVSADANTCTLP